MKKHMLMACLLAAPLLAMAADRGDTQPSSRTANAQSKRLTEADRKVTAGRILLKWGGYVEQVNGQNRRAWAASLWPSLASADLDNLQKASRAVTYEGMRNALLGQRPHDNQIIDAVARSNTKVAASGNPVTKALGDLAADLVFTPITPCRIVDTRVGGVRIAANATRDLDASNVGGNFSAQGGSNTNCGIPANPAALAMSVTGLSNTTTGYIRVFPHNGNNTQGSPVPMNVVNTTATNDIIVPACQGCAQELKVFSTANTHYAVFVTGYFMAPVATALDCIDGEVLEFPVPPNSMGQEHSYCPSGYTITGGGCDNTDFNARITASFTEVPNNGYFCEVWNGDPSVTATPKVFSACCRIPGR